MFEPRAKVRWTEVRTGTSDETHVYNAPTRRHSAAPKPKKDADT